MYNDFRKYFFNNKFLFIVLLLIFSALSTFVLYNTGKDIGLFLLILVLIFADGFKIHYQSNLDFVHYKIYPLSNHQIFLKFYFQNLKEEKFLLFLFILACRVYLQAFNLNIFLLLILVYFTYNLFSVQFFVFAKRVKSYSIIFKNLLNFVGFIIIGILPYFGNKVFIFVNNYQNKILVALTVLYPLFYSLTYKAVNKMIKKHPFYNQHIIDNYLRRKYF